MPEPSTGKPIILVIDDDDAMRRALTRMLGSEGFGTLEASDGAEGLVVYAEHEHEIKAATLDLLMPGTGGPDTLATLARFAPTLPVVVCTALPPPHDELVPPPGTRGIGYIQKPFTAPELAAELRRVIAEVEGQP
jgi:CheY-like chemotaxis protein